MMIGDNDMDDVFDVIAVLVVLPFLIDLHDQMNKVIWMISLIYKKYSTCFSFNVHG